MEPLTNSLCESALLPQHIFKTVVREVVMAFVTLEKNFNRAEFRAGEIVMSTKAAAF